MKIEDVEFVAVHPDTDEKMAKFLFGSKESEPISATTTETPEHFRERGGENPYDEAAIDTIQSWPPPEQDVVHWGTAGSITVHRERAGFRFGVILQPVAGEWQAIGLVTRLLPDDLTAREAVDATLDHHAHQNLGTFRNFDGPGGVREAALRFVHTAAVPEDMCHCEPVEPTATTERET